LVIITGKNLATLPENLEPIRCAFIPLKMLRKTGIFREKVLKDRLPYKFRGKI
jgi:hypothetical protein